MWIFKPTHTSSENRHSRPRHGEAADRTLVDLPPSRRFLRLFLILGVGILLGKTTASVAHDLSTPDEGEPGTPASVVSNGNAPAKPAESPGFVNRLPAQERLALAPTPKKAEEKAPEMASAADAQGEKAPPKEAAKKAPAIPFVGSDSVLSQKMRWLLEDYETPEAAVVVIDVHTGEILAAEGRKAGKVDASLVHQARWPAASVFKVVTAAALMGQGLAPSTQECFNGGRRKVTLKQLKAKGGGRCADFSTAFARSYNVPFARWADQKLDQIKLAAFASALGFGDGSVLGLPQQAAGHALIPDDRLEYARTAAGFGDVTLSPLHGATLAAAVAAGGEAPAPQYGPAPSKKKTRILPVAHANALQSMMVKTVTSGSARRAFRERRRPALGKEGAGGKTGSLFVDDKDLTWFVGFAPAKNPRVAVAAYVVNGPKWRIRAAYLGRAALRSQVLGTSPYRPTQDPLLAKK
jgi:hypothetical protein